MWMSLGFSPCPSPLLSHSSLREEMSHQKNKTEQNQRIRSLSPPCPRPLFLGNQSLSLPLPHRAEQRRWLGRGLRQLPRAQDSGPATGSLRTTCFSPPAHPHTATRPALKEVPPFVLKKGKNAFLFVFNFFIYLYFHLYSGKCILFAVHF